MHSSDIFVKYTVDMSNLIWYCTMKGNLFDKLLVIVKTLSKHHIHDEKIRGSKDPLILREIYQHFISPRLHCIVQYFDILHSSVMLTKMIIFVTCFAKTCHLCTPCQRTVFTINGYLKWQKIQLPMHCR